MVEDLSVRESTWEVEVRDIEYLDWRNEKLTARVFQPIGPGPFPAAIDVHGGAWTEGDRFSNDAINMPLARRGVVVLSIEYSVPPKGVYPSSVQDVNYAVRWLKANAGRFNTTPDRVGVLGTSSGGHLAVLAALKPFDPRYAAIPLDEEHDARVRFAVAMWPVICPFTRYQQVVMGGGVQASPDRAGAGVKQMTYWLTDEAMKDGSPVLAISRGDDIDRPPIFYVQNPTDRLHPLESAVEFAQHYRARGGELDMHLVHGSSYNLVRTEPESREAKLAVERMASFVHAKCRA
jgi:acetyl esterase